MKKLFVVLIMVISLPVAASMVGSRHRAQAFNSVAVAGRSVAGGDWCACGCGGDCICDPDEVPMACGEAAQPPDGSGVMLLLFAFALAARFALK